jgi:hypothetical protein
MTTTTTVGRRTAAVVSSAIWLIPLLVSAVQAGQEPARDVPIRAPFRGTSVVSGTVVADDQTHTPVRHATLTLTRPGGNDARTTATDDQGRFVFSDLPAATYTLAATKGAYLTANYGAVSPGAPPVPIPLKDGQRFAATPIVLIRGAVITGRVVDPNGRPIANARVSATQFDVSGGERQPRTAAVDGGFATTDSRGIYRMWSLAAGDYVVSVVATLNSQPTVLMTPAEQQWIEQRQGSSAAPNGPPPASRPFIAAPTYFLGTADLANASVVTLGRAEERQGVDISVVRVGTARVSGLVVGLDGQPAAGAVVIRSSKQKGATPLMGPLGGLSRSGSDGAFVMNGVTPGEYTVSVRATATPVTAPIYSPGLDLPAGTLTLWGQADLTVNGDDVTGLEIRLQPGMTVSGTIIFQGTSAVPTELVRYRPVLAPVDRNQPTVAVNGGSTAPASADRTFKLEGVTPGLYRLTGIGDFPSTSETSQPWVIKSVLRAGQDMLDTAFEIRPGEDLTDVVVTYSDRQTELDGRLIDVNGQPASQFRVVVFSTNRERWALPALQRWIASIRAGVDGSFRVTGLPPGEYYVSAFTDNAQSQQDVGAILESLAPASIKITLADGEKHAQTFRVGG